MAPMGGIREALKDEVRNQRLTAGKGFLERGSEKDRGAGRTL